MCIYLAMIDVANGADVDVRLVALEDGGVGPGELSLAPRTQCLLHRVDAIPGAQSAGGLKEGASERHDEARRYTPNTERQSGGDVVNGLRLFGGVCGGEMAWKNVGLARSSYRSRACG